MIIFGVNRTSLVTLLLLFFSSLLYATELERLDPHGQKGFDFRVITSLENHQECSTCHLQGKSKLALKPQMGLTCFDCHNRAPHSGAAEHQRVGVSCLGCHVAHRSQAKSGDLHGSFLSEYLTKNHQIEQRSNPQAMIRKTCTECHKQPANSKNGTFAHLKHHKSFEKLDVKCTDCHSVDFKAESKDPLAKTMSAQNFKVPKSVCQECHGFAITSHFANRCRECHGDKEHHGVKKHGGAGESQSPVSTSTACLDCHQQKGKNHRNLQFEGATTTCLKCHLEQKFEHRSLSLLKAIPGFKNQYLDGKSISCLTCHQVHHKPNSGTSLTARNRSEKLCASCHGQKAHQLIEKLHRHKQ